MLKALHPQHLDTGAYVRRKGVRLRDPKCAGILQRVVRGPVLKGSRAMYRYDHVSPAARRANHRKRVLVNPIRRALQRIAE